MLPRKSSNITQKGESILKTKLKLRNEQPKYQRVQNNFVSVDYQQNKNIGIKNPTLIVKSTINRTLIRKPTTNSLIGGQNLQTTTITNNSSLYTNSKILKNSVTKNVVNLRSGESMFCIQQGQKQVNIQEKMIKTPIRNIAKQNSVNQQKYTKSRAYNMFNPEQKKSTTMTTANKDVNAQMLNTRKSKFETDSNLKNLKKDQNKQNGERSKQIKIHPVRNLGSKVSKKQQQKIGIKEVSNNREDEIKIETKQQQSITHQPQSNRVVQIQQAPNMAIQPYQDSIISSSSTSSSHQLPHIHDNSPPPHNNLSSQIRNQQQQQSITTHEIQNTNLSSHNISNQHQLTEAQVQHTNNQTVESSNIDLSSLIRNTQDIIDFINRLNLRNRMQAFDLMVTQLSQLNLIAQQVYQLGQIGNALGYSLVNVFGARIRQLQTTIINQVGIALITTFQERIDPEFQSLVIREPSLRTGFNKIDIQKTFDEKLTLQEVQCSICLENVKLGQKVIYLQCYHKFHPICIKTWLQNSKKCPLCRAEQKRKTD